MAGSGVLAQPSSGNPKRKHRGNIMTHPEHPFPRRTLIKGAGLGLIAGAMGQTRPAMAEDANATPDNSEIWSGEYWAKKGDVPLWMFRKRLSAPKAGEPSRPIVFF